jgi:hypothetical protein
VLSRLSSDARSLLASMTATATLSH